MPDHASGQPLPEWVTWACCDQMHNDGAPCTGAAQSGYRRCLAHLDDAQLTNVMASRSVDARGCRMGMNDLNRVFTAVGRDGFFFRLGAVILARATVKGDLHLVGATVHGGLYLDHATVEGGILLEVTVEGDVSLSRAKVKGDVSLGLYLDHATVEGDVSLFEATVEGDVSLRATVKGGVSLSRAKVKGDVSLSGATVEGKALLGPMSTTTLSLAGTEFIRLVNLDVTAKRVELSRARVLAGLKARVGEAEVVMERVEVQGPAVLACASPGSVTSTSPPRLLQLAGTDVAALALTGVNLSACCFFGAINLDKLHIDGSPQLAMRQGWQAHRKVIAEEHVWRHVYGPARRRDGWYPSECQPRDREEAQRTLDTEASRGTARERAQEIATVYRALRKGREDGKDEPGAADFYYGEMEMRRKAAGGSVEGALLTGYWLLSGYGLRTWRALAALIALIAAATVLFATIGLARTSVTVYRPIPPRAGTGGGAPSYLVTTIPGPRPGWVTGFDYSMQSTTSLIRSPSSPPPLTNLGRALEIFLRFAGPGLLALAVLALRARVKR